MEFEHIPKICPEIVGRHIIETADPSRLIRFIEECKKGLRKENEILYVTIEHAAQRSDDPLSVRYAAYCSLTMINRQLSSKDLDRIYGV